MPQEIYPVDLIISHVSMHEDELCAIATGKRWGGKLLPGFAEAPIRLIDAGLHLEIGHDGDYYLKFKRAACIGVLGGWCDEHAQFHDGVRRNAATKMADHLGVSKDPGLAPILEYSLRADRDAGISHHDEPPVHTSDGDRSPSRAGTEAPAPAALAPSPYG